MESLAKLLMKTLGKTMIKRKRNRAKTPSKIRNNTNENSSSSTTSYSKYSVSDFLMDLEVSNHILEDKTSTPVNLHIEPLNRMERKILDADVACHVSGIKVYEDEDEVEKEDNKMFSGRKVFISGAPCNNVFYENTKFYNPSLS